LESPNVGVQSRSFRSTSISLLSSRYEDRNNIDSIGPDTILFEGCDYNHWLFVMDFPKDNKPPPEEMIRVYEETCAKGLNIRFFSSILSSNFLFWILNMLCIIRVLEINLLDVV
jgi:hypothetical protein